LKRSNFEDDLEPPPLKIRIFKGNSGELINEKEARRSKKRKKRTQKEKEKVKKIVTEKDVGGMKKASEVDESTQNRILQELPGCNWLENKIKRREDPIEPPKPSENNVGNQLDALLESDSDEDYLVVDDQIENCEITTSSKLEDADVEPPLNNNSLETAEEKSLQNNNSGPIMNTSADAKQEEVGEAQSSHTFTYMLGNLMKKLDKTTANGGLNCTQKHSDNKNQKIDESSSLVTNGKKDQSINGVSETDEVIEIPNPKGTTYNACKDIGSSNSMEDPRKQYANNGLSHTIPVPKMISKEISDHQNIAKRNLNAMEIASRNAQDFYFQQQILEKKKIEDQLNKDIEDLKNKKIKEMEDLIEIKTKKEQTMNDLENLKAEIMKNKSFLESLKKIKFKDDSKSQCSPVKAVEEPKQGIPMNNTSQNRNIGNSPELVRPKLHNRALPDLVSHEKTAPSDKITHKRRSTEYLQNLNLSPEYIKYLERLQDSRDNPKFVGRTTPPELYSKHTLPANPELKIIRQKSLEGGTQHPTANMNTTHMNIHSQNHRPNPPQVHNMPPTILQNVMPEVVGEAAKLSPTKNINSRAVSITKVQNETRTERSTEASVQNKNIPRNEAQGFIRPRSFSREENITSASDLNKLMNSQYGARNLMPTPPINQNHVRQEMTGPVNFPEIRSAIAASEDRRVQRAQPRTPTSNIPYTNQTHLATNTLSKCAVCNKVANFLCSGCQKVYYCTVQCQSHHWLSHYTKCVGAKS